MAKATSLAGPRSHPSIREFFGNTEGLYRATRRLVVLLQSHYYPHALCEPEDVTNDLMYKWYVGGNLETYNCVSCSPTHYLRTVIRRHLISEERRALAQKRQYNNLVSGDEIVPAEGGEDNVTLFETIADTSFFPPDKSALLNASLDALRQLPSWGAVARSPITNQSVQLSHFEVVVHSLAGYTTRELASLWNVSRTRVTQIFADAVARMGV